jgi:hypothetical protein
MAATPTAPLSPPDEEPVEVVLYVEKMAVRLATLIIMAFVGIVTLWTFKPPDLPGDAAGSVMGAFLLSLGAITGYFFSRMGKQQKQ